MTRRPRPFRFGVVLRLAESGRAWAERARFLEDNGVATLLVPDHFVGPRFAAIPAMAAAAAATTRLRIGTLVLANDYRHPVLLAKEAATLDVLSDGRIEVGLGTGWLRSEYDATGLSFDPPPVRLSRFAEAVTILKGVWGPGAFSFAGEHYRIDALEQEPKPVQKPHPPLLFPGGGARMLRLAAREADSINLTMRVRPDGSAPDETDGGLAAFLDKIRVVREAAGDRFDDIELGTSVLQVASPDDRESWSAANFSHQGETPQVLLGAVTDMVDKLRHWRDEHGLSYLVLHNERHLDAFLPVVRELAGT